MNIQDLNNEAYNSGHSAGYKAGLKKALAIIERRRATWLREDMSTIQRTKLAELDVLGLILTREIKK